MISVLLIDDEPAILEIAQLFLEETGSFLVDTSPSGSQALLRISEKQYDIIVSDYEMPGMNGISLIRMLKQRGNSTPVIIFTGEVPEQVVIDTLNQGASFVIQKSGDPTAIFAELAQRCKLCVQQRRSEMALNESDAKYRAMVEHAPEDMLILDVQGTILLANTAAVKTIDSDSSASLSGRNMMEFIAPESRERVCRDFARLEPGHGAYVAEYEAVTGPGNRIRIESTSKAITYESKPAILVSISKKPLQKAGDQRCCEHEVMVRTLTEHAEQGVLIVEGDHIRYANPCLAAMTGYPADELQNMVFWDLVHPAFRDELKAQVHDRKKTGNSSPDHAEVLVNSKEGAEYQVRLGMTPMVFDEKPAMLVTARDITVQRLAESRLEQLEKKLHLLHEVTHHDLLNNVTALYGYFEIIRQNTVDSYNLEFMKKQETILSAIREQIHFTGYYRDSATRSPGGRM